MTRSLSFLPGARQDLREIWEFTATRWSVRQADRYVADIRRAVDTLRDFPELARLRTEIRPPLRLHPVRSHLIAYFEATDALIVVRILHARADWRALLGT